MVDILKPYQGGVFFYTADKLDQIKDAFMEFQNNNDTKAAMILAFAFQSGQVRVYFGSVATGSN
jgi:hypothetical protein